MGTGKELVISKSGTGKELVISKIGTGKEMVISDFGTQIFFQDLEMGFIMEPIMNVCLDMKCLSNI